MMKLKRLKLIVLLMLPSLAFAETDYSGYLLKVLEPLDQRIVVKLPNNKMQVLKIDDQLGDSQAVVKEIFAEKIILEELTTTPSGDKVKQKVIMHKARNGRSRIERMSVIDENNRHMTKTSNYKN
jgi:hypothetical protein